jgi:hypothetical protein
MSIKNCLVSVNVHVTILYKNSKYSNWTIEFIIFPLCGSISSNISKTALTYLESNISPRIHEFSGVRGGLKSPPPPKKKAFLKKIVAFFARL